MYALAMIEDITEVKRAQEIENQLASDLAASRDEIRALAASLIRAQEDERHRVSRELHDHICQQLGSLAADMAGLVASPLPEDVQLQLKELRARVVKTSQETHDIAYQMHTAILDDLGLVASLKACAESFPRSIQISPWTLRTVVHPPQFPVKWHLASTVSHRRVYRIWPSILAPRTFRSVSALRSGPSC
jgi:signal transduction histidine kinase